jgi:hypothetical protein
VPAITPPRFSFPRASVRGTGANELVAVFAERESPAAYFLQEQGMTRDDAINYIGDGIKL